jgi:transposase-like protein
MASSQENFNMRKLTATARQQIFTMLDQGGSLAAIAQRFSVAPGTVRNIAASRSQRLLDFNTYFARREIIRLLLAIRSHLLVTPERQAVLKGGTGPEKAAKLIRFRQLVSREFDRLLGCPVEFSKLWAEAKYWQEPEKEREEHQRDAPW